MDETDVAVEFWAEGDWIDCPKCGANDWDESQRELPGEPIICRKCGNWEFA